MTALAINREAISATYNRMRNRIRRTPTLQIAASDLELGLEIAELHLKLELLQCAGSFKARGAVANFLSGDISDAGVTAASGGNHGVAVAFAARQFGHRATIFVPRIAAPAKIAAIESWGADLRIVGERYADALAAAEEHCAASGARNIHAYDQEATLVGQGSLGLELEAQLPGLTTLLVAVGGGGLIGGIAAWYQGRVKLVAVEPERCPTLHAATQAGEPVDVEVGGVAADSLGARRIGRLAFPLCQTYVEEVVTVSDEAIAHAQVRLLAATRLLAEPGGATALAALLSGAYKPGPDERVGVIICGGNTDVLPASI